MLVFLFRQESAKSGLHETLSQPVHLLLSLTLFHAMLHRVVALPLDHGTKGAVGGNGFARAATATAAAAAIAGFAVDVHGGFAVSVRRCQLSVPLYNTGITDGCTGKRKGSFT